MTDIEILQVLVRAKELGISQEQVDAFRPKPAQIMELTKEDIARLIGPSNDYTDEEIFYYATPYFDELQAKKMAKEEAISSEVRSEP